MMATTGAGRMRAAGSLAQRRPIASDMHGSAHKRVPSSKDIREAAEKVSATIGIEFFQSMVRHLCAALSADCVYIGEFIGGQVERVRVLAAVVRGEPDRNFEYVLAGSASADAVLGKRCVCRTAAQSEFPEDAMLATLAAEAFVGVPLTNAEGHSLGILMAVYSRPVSSFRAQTSMLEIFAPRATAELSRKQSEEQLRESEERYRTFIAANPDGMWRVELDPPVPTVLPAQAQAERIHQDGYVAECNDALARMLGRNKAGDLIGCRLSEIADTSSDYGISTATEAAVGAGYRLVTIETQPVDKFGKKHYMLRSQWGVVQHGSLRRIWGITRDITELRNSELELEASEQRLADLLEAIHLVVVMLDLDGSITYCNEYLLRLTGWKLGDIKGRNWFDLMIPEDERQVLRAATESAKDESSAAPVHLESTLLGPGNRRWRIAWDFTLLWNAGGNTASAVFVGRDATEYKELESQFRQAQKLESVGRLAGGVAHDFNNLLTVIIGYAAALQTDRDPADPAYIPLAEIRKAAEKGSDLAHQLLTFSSRQPFHPTLLNLNTLIIEDQRMLQRLLGDNVELVTELDAGLGAIRADAGHMRQVLMNLALNARDAMPHGGKLVISSSNKEANGAKLADWTGLQPGSYVLLSVADTGIGMSEEVSSHIFEPFFTTKAPGKGTGLGLSTVYGIVQQSHGHIFVDTKPDQGTAFSLFFPRFGEASGISGCSPQTSLKGGKETVLLVEDNYQVRVLTAKTLRQLGYKVCEAEGPDHALELAKQSGTHFDLLLTDLIMPRMDGVELAHRMRSAQPGIKILLMSGSARHSEPNHDRALQEHAYIQKPFAPETLGSKVRETLDQG
jgi:PAS domain S-box-containing protein